MPPHKQKYTKTGGKLSGSSKTKKFMENYLDTPAKRTRSASGKIQGKMAATTEQDRETSQHAQGTINTIHEENSSAPEGFVAGMVEQINNSPMTTPVKGKTLQLDRHDAANHSTMTGTLNITSPIQPNLPIDDTSNANITATMQNSVLKEKVDKMELADIFLSLNTTMQGIQTELRRLNTGQQTNTCKVSTLEFVQKDEVQAMRKVQVRLDQQEHAIEMLLNHVEKQDQQILELTNKQNESQARSMKKNLIVTGIPEVANENCMILAQTFLQRDLQLSRPVQIKLAHRLGNGNNRPMVLKLVDINDKSFILQNSQKLKGTNLFIMEQLPEEMAEKKRQQQRLKGQNKKLPSTEQLLLNIKKDKIFINNERFRSPLVSPTSISWLAKDEDERKAIKKTKILKGATDSTTSSTFISYGAEVKSVEEVQKAYYKVFTLEPRATHIVCAYMLPGRNFPTNQNGEDDREFGASRQLLRSLQQGSHFYRAVFVARYYGGDHLGPDRFRIYKEMAQAALDKLPAPADTRLDLNTLLGHTPVTLPLTSTTATTSVYTFQPPLPALVRMPSTNRPPFNMGIPTTTTWSHPLPIQPSNSSTSSWADASKAASELQHSQDEDEDDDQCYEEEDGETGEGFTPLRKGNAIEAC